MERGVFLILLKKKSVESLLIGSKLSELLKEVCQNRFVIWRGSGVAWGGHTLEARRTQRNFLGGGEVTRRSELFKLWIYGTHTR